MKSRCFVMFVVHVSDESCLAENLERLGGIQSENEADISKAFMKFAVVTKELSALMKNLVRRYPSSTSTFMRIILVLCLSVTLIIILDICGCCSTVRGVSERGPVTNQGPHQIQN